MRLRTLLAPTCLLLAAGCAASRHEAGPRTQVVGVELVPAEQTVRTTRQSDPVPLGWSCPQLRVVERDRGGKDRERVLPFAAGLVNAQTHCCNFRDVDWKVRPGGRLWVEVRGEGRDCFGGGVESRSYREEFVLEGSRLRLVTADDRKLATDWTAEPK